MCSMCAEIFRGHRPRADRFCRQYTSRRGLGHQGETEAWRSTAKREREKRNLRVHSRKTKQNNNNIPIALPKVVQQTALRSGYTWHCESSSTRFDAVPRQLRSGAFGTLGTLLENHAVYGAIAFTALTTTHETQNTLHIVQTKKKQDQTLLTR